MPTRLVLILMSLEMGNTDTPVKLARSLRRHRGVRFGEQDHPSGRWEGPEDVDVSMKLVIKASQMGHPWILWDEASERYVFFCICETLTGMSAIDADRENGDSQ